jgi:hypothetical protein
MQPLDLSTFNPSSIDPTTGKTYQTQMQPPMDQRLDSVTGGGASLPGQPTQPAGGNLLGFKGWVSCDLVREFGKIYHNPSADPVEGGGPYRLLKSEVLPGSWGQSAGTGGALKSSHSRDCRGNVAAADGK